MKKILLSAAGIVMAASLLACPPPAAAQAMEAPSHAASAGIAAKLMVRDSVRGLRVESLRSQRRNDVMVVQAEILNTRHSNAQLYFRFRWLDADGMQQGDEQAWKPLTFLGLQNRYVTGVAGGPQAVDFRIEMSAESP
ncbi:Predicted periplasmic lipoprotein [Bordetella ansorpii]|uniref:Predicted periplasmic lipoprotein n=1 Tax=Bordetella ansorpii TaxID=288768 RepID=A0A157Q904_9BORD|nr:YcfL family protein [Bordetella ansorpii]SAI42098.1 Predicted periplasmic lipoprotein [Bordetella ansorpii]